MSFEKILYVGVKTTGRVAGEDEILQIAILEDSGQFIMNNYVKPRSNKVWPRAQAIHGISPEMVEDAETFRDILEEIQDLTRGKIIITSKQSFDWAFILAESPFNWYLKQSYVVCAMRKFAPFLGNWDEFSEYWHSVDLVTAAKHVGHDWGDTQFHDAPADCRATRSVWHYINDEKQIPFLKQKEREAEDNIELGRSRLFRVF